ncbi:uncharacterized protein LOC124259694 [Haliotis rubra]|uniref:uncharacterized protein LOC124259694 n=1 Tax=Haliotis rubra TaxID=36100 RepID=UPI001EE573BD|nr:uncharacterized protein LOC124259694 [Haliotis rubra]
MKVKVKQEPPDEELSAILDHGIQLASVDEEAEGLITQQIEEILPDEGDDDDDDDDEDYEVEEEEEEETQDLPKRKIKCRRCDFKAKTKKELDRHEARHAIKGWYHECQYCDYVTHIRQRLQEHEAKHTNTKPFKCEKCEFRTRFKADLYKHRAKHSTVKRFSCPQCDFRTKWCRNIKHHMLKHTEDRPHSCDICGFRFKRLQDLKYHLFRHNDLKPVQCDLCDFRCKTNYELKCHRLKHSNVKNFSCTFPGCPQKTKTKSDLTKHLKTHNKDNSFLCSICGKGFNTLTSLNKHKDRHSNVRKFKCGLCEKWFKNKPSLRAHMKVHSGIKPFQCDVCLRNFLNKYNMQKHKETHTGDRPYSCPICPYGARTSDHLLAHIGSMHGDSHAYFCELCRKPFKRYSQLQVHIKRMHKNVNSIDRNDDGKLDIKLEPGPDGTITTGTDVFSVKKIGDCHFEPEVKRKRGRPRKNRQLVPEVVPIPEQEPHNNGPENVKPAKVKLEEVESEETVKLATYQDGFRLPLATRGFHFNFDKTGKKPKSWFMQPENMYGKAAVKQRAYMEKKERFFDRLNSGRIQRTRKKSDVVFKTMVTRNSIRAGTQNSTDKLSESDPHKLLISGRTKLKTMRKIRRRIRKMKACLEGSPFLKSQSVQTLDNNCIAEVSDGARSSMGGCSVDSDATLDEPVTQVKGPCSGDELVSLVKEIHSEDEDDVPLSQLKSKEVPNEQLCVETAQLTPGAKYVSRSQLTSATQASGSHIKLVLKRRKEGTFKVTLNTSAEVSTSSEVETSSNMIPSHVSDVYSRSLRILGKSLQTKCAKTNKALKSKAGIVSGDTSTRSVRTRHKSVINAVKPKPSQVIHGKKKTQQENKTNTARVSKVLKGLGQTSPKNTKLKKNVAKSGSSKNDIEKAKKKELNPKGVRKGTKSPKPKNKITQKGKKKTLICSLCTNTTTNKKSNHTCNSSGINNQYSATRRRFLQTQPYDEFPIKIEPVDDDYSPCEMQLGTSPALDDLNPGTVVVKQETAEMVAGEDCPITDVDVKMEECESLSQCKYLYDVKPAVEANPAGASGEATLARTLGEANQSAGASGEASYVEHAIAWGLKLDPQVKTNALDSTLLDLSTSVGVKDVPLTKSYLTKHQMSQSDDVAVPKCLKVCEAAGDQLALPIDEAGVGGTGWQQSCEVDKSRSIEEPFLSQSQHTACDEATDSRNLCPNVLNQSVTNLNTNSLYLLKTINKRYPESAVAYAETVETQPLDLSVTRDHYSGVTKKLTFSDRLVDCKTWNMCEDPSVQDSNASSTSTPVLFTYTF